jgi:protein MAK11
MAKRKRSTTATNDSPRMDEAHSLHMSTTKGKIKGTQDKRQKLLPNRRTVANEDISIQIIVGTYEKRLHGLIATISADSLWKGNDSPNARFAETFLFNAHASAIRCLAISPPSLSSDATDHQKAILASGSSDHSINLYHISTSPPRLIEGSASGLSLAGRTIAENPRNRELGSLQPHSSNINALHFPTRSKLLSAADDNTVAITRTRDWTVLSTIKPPIPKAHGRPSGDTAPFGGTPTGVNDFAVHPSMKLMVTVGKGEKCMRLWNLVTGKKAGVLNFPKELLEEVGEGKWFSGEGRRVRWNSLGEEFVVGFEKGAVVFGMVNLPVAFQHYKD